MDYPSSRSLHTLQGFMDQLFEKIKLFFPKFFDTSKIIFHFSRSILPILSGEASFPLTFLLFFNQTHPLTLKEAFIFLHLFVLYELDIVISLFSCMLTHSFTVRKL